MLVLFAPRSVNSTAHPGSRFTLIRRLAGAAASLSALLSLAALTACGGASGGSSNSATASSTQNLALSAAGVQVSAATAARFAVAMDDLEVIGPFPSWANAKRDYGAVGDGVADDTAALQAALNDLGQNGKASVLYLPAGNYKITASLQLTGAAVGFKGLGIVGDAPSTTRITWAGPSGGAMLVQNGGYNTRYSRITWDGKSTAGYGVAHWWNTQGGALYDGSPEHTDEVFQDMAIGIMAGRMGAAYGKMNSEGQIRRVTFLRNTYAGLNTGSWNALNWWVWDSQFIDCARGLTNSRTISDTSTTDLGAGGMYVYRSLFKRSTVADFHVHNTGWFSLQHNVSTGSRRFFQSEIMGNNGSPTIIQGNRVLDTTDAAAVMGGNLGPLVLLDNQFRSAPGNTGPVIAINDWAPGRDVLSVGNQYTVAQPIQTPDTGDRHRSINDSTVAYSAISSTLPSMPATPQRPARQVFEVAANAGGADIQAAINAAANSGATNPIVHLPPGTYIVRTPLLVPARARIQIAGDALNTIVSWMGPANGIVFDLQGPSYATVRDLQVWGATDTTAFNIRSADQVGGRIFIEGSSPGPMQVSNLASTQITMQATPHINSIDLNAVQNFVTIGNGILGPVRTTGSSSALIADTWYEGTDSALYRIDDGNFTFLGGHLAPASHAGALAPNDPAVVLNNFRGNASFIGTRFDLTGVPSGVGVQIGAESAQTNALFLGMTPDKTPFFNRTSSGGNVALSLSQAGNGASGQVSTPDQGPTGTDFLLKMLAQTRALVWDTAGYTAPSGATDVRLYRVKADQSGGLKVTNQ